jgi:hypothetical protein
VKAQDPDLLRRFEFERWRRPAADEVKYFLWQLTIGERLLGDWEPARVQQESLAGDCLYTTSVWRSKTGEGMLRLDVYEEPSRQAAEVRLLDLLADIQSPLVRRDETANYPLFRYGDDATLAFARGNVAFFAANAERKVVPLTKILTDLDRLFTAGPEKPAALRPLVTVAEIADVRVGAAVPLGLNTDYPLPVWYRLETKLGEVRRDGSRLLYEAEVDGDEVLVVVAIGTDGRATRTEHTLRALA